ncbi:hypothetical protein HY212_01610 [Candidatus Pacearchaeota archaeon]|nr:hypothetical protein [Candidatus Pacearchaeota archaeon]
MIYKTIVIAIIFLLGQIIIPSYASAPEHIAPGISPFEHAYTDIKFLDAYFGTSSGKIEVQPGDKNVPFTVVFSNVGSEDIAGIKGLLSLPAGFSPAIANANAGLIEADNTQVATSGSSFFLTFFVNVDKNTNINSYSGTVQVTYSRVRENGSHTNYFDFNFKVPGKSVLNMKAENQFIQPASNNQITVQVSNDGTAGLNNIDITLNPQSNSSGSSSLQNIVIDQNHWNIGTVAAQSSSTFSFNIFVPQDVTGQTLHIPLGVTYFDGQGNQITTSRLVDLIVGPASSTFVVRLSTPSYLMMGVMQNLTLGLENLSPSKISDISITLVPSSSDLKILQDPRWFINNINPLERTALNIPVFADQNISNQAVNFDVNIQYTKDGSTVIEKQSFATYIRPVIDISVYGVDVMNIGGKQNIIGNILNQGNIKGQFATVTIQPIDNSKIKKSVQYIGDIDIDAPTPFNIPIDFIGNPSFGENKVVVTVIYKDSLLQPHTIIQENTITLANPTPQTNDTSQLQLIILVAIAAGIGGIVFKIRKAKLPITKKVAENSS